MSENHIQGIMNTTMDKIKSMASADTIIGEQINLPEGVTLIPVSKVSYGFASGGSDFPSKTNASLFGGGGGAGMTITPIAVMVVKDGNVKIMHIDSSPNSTDKIVSLVPELFDKVVDLFKKDKKNVVTEEE
ncbi:MAG: sporulation protein YtfJ [Clostridiales bacterium 43-6]|nr:MAG: sporulation protein YtfJ [Clostridiales bacterium 43-6]